MAKKELDSVIRIDGEDYSITAGKVAHSLTINTIKNGNNESVVFNGSEDLTIDIVDIAEAGSAENANKIQVNMDNDKTEYATITISATDPTDGNIGDIWFKHAK